ncbi:glycosyltransferase family 2 protein [Peribacillus psychrosaccharolyticus]|uniref:glycosyltransferase family 2 protein n=1 Tax=Peribacillus psychrosaccharolyticus TaxID=1407 RepID=UPI003D2BBA2A
MVEKKRVTVFTPTYNRAYILDRVYESLKIQTNQSFVWLIIDDGSTDHTYELINEWLTENYIKIQYFKQKNGGKQRAHNKGVELCDTELFICVDSDDFLPENAIDSFISIWDSIEEKSELSGIVALRGYDRNTPIGTSMPNNLKISPLNDLYNKHGFTGDTALLFRTDILRRFPFYVADGEKFIGEGYIYNQIDQDYSMYIENTILYIGEYLNDGYTANVKKLTKENPKSYTVLKRQAVTLSKTFKSRYLNTVKYLIGCILSKERHPIQNAPFKYIAIFAYPPALFLYWKWYR